MSFFRLKLKSKFFLRKLRTRARSDIKLKRALKIKFENTKNNNNCKFKFKTNDGEQFMVATGTFLGRCANFWQKNTVKEKKFKCKSLKMCLHGCSILTHLTFLHIGGWRNKKYIPRLYFHLEGRIYKIYRFVILLS